MKELKINIKPDVWGDLKSRNRSNSKATTVSDFTSGSSNFDTDVTGNITKVNGTSNYNGTLLAAPLKDQYEAIFSDGTRHMLAVQSGEIKYSTGDTLFNSVVNGTGFSSGSNFEFTTTQDRIYGGNGVNPSQVYDITTSYGGVAYTAPRMKNMGCQVPSSTLTASVGAAGNVPAGTYTYKVTYLYYDFEESNGSVASASVSPGVASQISLSSIPIGDYGVTARKIYRSSGPDWVLVLTINDNTTTSATDDAAAGTTPIPEDNNLPPVFSNISSWLGRLWVSKITGNPYLLQFSDTTLPDIYPSDNVILCNEQDPITGTYVYLDRLVVFNRKTMGQILGLDSDTFRYSAIQGSVGCVDNRSIQVRVVDGVPLLIWLSDRGVYSFDGNSVNYISQSIEDLVNLNIQQAIQQKNSNTQTTQSQFQAGIASQGIDLTSSPGTITTINPKSILSSQADWEGGLTKTNVTTKDGNLLKMPLANTFSLSSGSYNTAYLTGSGTIELPLRSNWNQWGDVSTFTSATTTVRFHELVNKITVPYASGQISNFQFPISIVKTNVAQPTTANIEYRLYSDSSGTPGTLLETKTGSISTPSVGTFTDLGLAGSFSTTLAQGSSYWVGIRLTNRQYNTPGALDFYTFSTSQNIKTTAPSNTGPITYAKSSLDTFQTALYNPGSGPNISVPYFRSQFVFSQNAVSGSGQWTSVSYDSLSIYPSGTMTYRQDISIPSGTSVVSYIEASSDDSIWNIISTQTDLDGSATFAASAYRYWRVRSVLSTTDDRTTPTITNLLSGTYSVPRLEFPSTAEWISNGIDLTTDVTAYNSLDAVSSIPSGTSLSIQVATSDDNITYTSYSSIGSATVKRYIRIKASFTTNSTPLNAINSLTPSITSITLKYTIVSNLISSGIDTGTTPAGWDIFSTTFSGLVTFQVRSSSTLGGLTSATFYTVTNGDYPNPSVLPLQFIQWKAIFTSTADTLPTVNDVTVGWFIGSAASIRVASIFVDGRYYLSAAELGETTNNVIIILDLDAKWRVRRGLKISTFSYFFNVPYCGMADSGQVRRFLIGSSDSGSNIEMDIRTKAFDFSTSEDENGDKYKIPKEVIVYLQGTGATYQMMFSLDEGQTFTNMVTDSGSTSYTTPTSGFIVPVRFKPNFTSDIQMGRTILYRIYNNDTKEAEIQGLKVSAFVRNGPPVVTG